MNKSKNLFLNTLKLSLYIFINKPLGLLRDILRVRYFGITIFGDAFSMAWRIPNTLRRIFGEGAVASVLTPFLIEIKEKDSEKELFSFISLLFISLQILVAIICFLVSIFSLEIVSFIASGAIDRIPIAYPMLKIMIFFTLFMSGATILSNSLQIKNIFHAGPLSQFFLNIALCLEFFLAIKYKLSIAYIPWFILINGLIIFFICFYIYLKNDFKFFKPTKKSFLFLIDFYKRLFPVFTSALIMELGPILDQKIISYLVVGSQSMFDYILGFIRVPLQIFGSSFATVNAPEFAKITVRKPKRMGFYLLESAKIMLFFTFPSTILCILFSYKAFYTLLLSKNFSLENVLQATKLLSIFSLSFFFSTFNKTLHNVFYANKNGSMVFIISLLTSLFGTFINLILFKIFNLNTFAISFLIVEIIRMIFFINYIKNFNIKFSYKKLLLFFKKIIKFYSIISIAPIIIYFLLKLIIYSSPFYNLLMDSLLYWVFILPSIITLAFSTIKFRKHFKINLYYMKF